MRRLIRAGKRKKVSAGGYTEGQFLRGIGLTLKTYRQGNKLTLEAIGKLIGITKETQCRRESGQYQWPLTDLVRYSEVLHVSPSTIVKDAESVASGFFRPSKSSEVKS